MSAIMAGCIVSAGPAPIPLTIQAAMKDPYVLARALHIDDARQMICEKMRTGRLPQVLLIGTLLRPSVTATLRHERNTHQMKLLKPNTRIQ